MSDTPETEAMRRQTWEFSNVPASPIPADFARKLERQRDAWRKCAEKFAAILSDETPLATFGTDVVEALEEFRRLKEGGK